MGCKLVLFLLVSGLLMQGTHAILCYNCTDCGDTEGEIYNCTSLSTFCYTTQIINTTQITKFCGNDEINFLGLSNSCDSQEDQIYCHCDTDLCNTNDLLSSSTSTIGNTTTSSTNYTALLTQLVERTTTTSTLTTTAAFSAPDGEPWTCYSCHDCGNSTGEIVTCSLIPAVTDCQLIKYPSGKIQRSCGRSIAGTETVEFGCSRTYRGYMQCRCNQRNCNEYPDITEGAPDVTTATTMLQTTTQSAVTSVESSGMAPNSSFFPQPSATATSQNTTTEEPPLFCYSCQGCGSSVGQLEDCSSVKSKSCLLLIEYRNVVHRMCQSPELELEPGCHPGPPGFTTCSCSESGCNEYPEATFLTIAFHVPTTSTPTTTWSCHVCYDCGADVGPSVSCASASSCILTIQRGVVTRNCASSVIDKVIYENEGCRITDNGLICKCSTPNCNAYPGITGRS